MSFSSQSDRLQWIWNNLNIALSNEAMDAFDLALDSLQVIPYSEDEINLLDRIDEFGHSLLHQAIFFGNFEAVKKLLDNGANPCILSSDKLSIFAMALLHNHYDILFFLLEKTRQSKHYLEILNKTLLRATFNNSDIEKVQLLLPYVNPNIKQTDSGNTLIHCAVGAKEYEIVTILILHPYINLALKNTEQRTPLEEVIFYIGKMVDMQDILPYLRCLEPLILGTPNKITYEKSSGIETDCNQKIKNIIETMTQKIAQTKEKPFAERTIALPDEWTAKLYLRLKASHYKPLLLNILNIACFKDTTKGLGKLPQELRNMIVTQILFDLVTIDVKNSMHTTIQPFLQEDSVNRIQARGM